MKKIKIIAAVAVAFLFVVSLYLNDQAANKADEIEQEKQAQIEQLEAEKEQLQGQLDALENEYAMLRDHIWNDRNYIEKVQGDN